MSIVVWEGESFAGLLRRRSRPIDVDGCASLELEAAVGAISVGTGLTLQLQTSDDLKHWSDVGDGIGLKTTGYGAAHYRAAVDKYKRWIRVEAELTGPDPAVLTSVSVNPYESS